MNTIQVGNTEVILQNYDLGQGKIIVSDLDKGSWSYYWGAMGGKTIEEFLKQTNGDYFAGKLCNEQYQFSAKNTARNIRQHIREEMNYDLPWYKFQSGQKELREKISDLEREASCKYEALNIIEHLHSSLWCLDMSYEDGKEFLSIIETHFTQEPWWFLGEELSQEYIFLKKLHQKLIKKLK